MNWLIGGLGFLYVGIAVRRWYDGSENGAIRAALIAALFFYVAFVLK